MTSVLQPPAYLTPQATLQISSQAPKILKSLRPSTIPLPYPLSLLVNTESPEKWQTYENLLLACLKTGDDQNAFLCVEELIARFGEDNERVQALLGVYKEALAKNDADLVKILEEYEEIIKSNEGNMRIRKRRVAVLKSLGRTQEALRALVKIVDVSPIDAEAWAEMAEINLEQGLYDKAVFCWEEALLVMPNAWNVHARVGEVEWMWAGATDDTKEKLRLVSSSLRRYCRSIELCDDYLRGYYGLKLTSSKLIELLGKTQKASSGFDSAGGLTAPPLPAVESLNELTTSKLSEIVRRGAAKESGWNGYNEAELIAARELLDRDTQNVQR
ncbi:hypothetical protein K461DRAFT_287639 [Myriangium duriaei CBS 260.36]|uniref:ER membrane protein complex subunit 2 n=1 Tax=Myriangium duriaei CBS 260.36 TaxID=1168546 RepID=A0A9P4ME65_9PEZI|nr:hypothetical protein K461DRAFT_287639 [Myriangium duriaei CBS 260.36]